jgi:hypothetical protein
MGLPSLISYSFEERKASNETAVRITPLIIRPNINASENQPPQYGSGFKILGICFRMTAKDRNAPRKAAPI